MQPLIRRSALFLGGVGAMAAATGAVGLLWGQGPGFQAAVGQELIVCDRLVVGRFSSGFLPG